MSEWSHLANAKHIDLIIAHAKANPKAWNAASPSAAYDAILALVTWDHAGGLMDLPAEQVKVLAILGDQVAILMYPAIIAMETTQELV